MTKPAPDRKVVAQNRKARHDFSIEDTLEAGIVLRGSEVKSLRLGRCQLTDAHADSRGGELWLVNAHIPEYAAANRYNHEPLRPRKLLVHKRQLARMIGAIERKGMALIPLSVYFSPTGLAKVELALAKGKKKADKRASEKEREWGRERQRLLKAKN